jgi:hypothetical protein
MADYNLKKVRALLLEGFTGEELRRFCYDTPDFRLVYNELAANSGKAEIVDRLLEYAERKGLFDPLLAWVAESNPVRYRTYLATQGDPSPASHPSAKADKSTDGEIVRADSSVTIGNVGGNIEGSTIAGRDVIIHHGPAAPPPGPTTPTPGEEQTSIWRLSSLWWVPLVVALIGLVGTLLPRILDSNAVPTPAGSFDYLVRVQAKDTGEDIANAEVTIEVGGQAPLNTITDSNGVARIQIRGDYAGKPGVLLVEATGHERYRENMDLIKDALPDVVQLERVP